MKPPYAIIINHAYQCSSFSEASRTDGAAVEGASRDTSGTITFGKSQIKISPVTMSFISTASLTTHKRRALSSNFKIF